MCRRKIEMKLVEDKEARVVTFSKRRSGILKKANELSIRCGVQVGILGFSPSGHTFSLGCPNIDVVTDKFLNGGHELGGPPQHDNIEKLSKQLADLEDVKNECQPIVPNGLSLEELQKLKTSLQQLRDDLEFRSFQIDLEATSSLLLLEKEPEKIVK